MEPHFGKNGRKYEKSKKRLYRVDWNSVLQHDKRIHEMELVLQNGPAIPIGASQPECHQQVREGLRITGRYDEPKGKNNDKRVKNNDVIDKKKTNGRKKKQKKKVKTHVPNFWCPGNVHVDRLEGHVFTVTLKRGTLLSHVQCRSYDTGVAAAAEEVDQRLGVTQARPLHDFESRSSPLPRPRQRVRIHVGGVKDGAVELRQFGIKCLYACADTLRLQHRFTGTEE